MTGEPRAPDGPGPTPANARTVGNAGAGNTGADAQTPAETPPPPAAPARPEAESPGDGNGAPPDGISSDGNGTPPDGNGTPPDGNTPDGDWPGANTPEGNAPDGSSFGGNVSGGSSSDGNTPDGDSPGGSPPDGNSPERAGPSGRGARRLAGLASGGALTGSAPLWKERSALASAAFHLALVGLLFVPGLLDGFGRDDGALEGRPRFDFRIAGGSGPGGGGGGGGSGGDRISAFIRPRAAEPPPPVPETPRQAPIAPRKPRPLRFEDLENLADASSPVELALGTVFSPQAVEAPGLSLSDFEDRGGRDLAPSAGTGDGIGGGEGVGTGEGQGWGVGPGYGGGSGGGAYAPGGYDVEPRLVYEPPEPPYPDGARRRRVSGEVMLQVLVKLDGSTEVLGVIKSGCRACVETARRHARKYRWEPALKDGKPVEAVGVITVTFGLFSGR